MKLCDKLTFVVFTYNEENRIERVLRNFSGWARVLVVDNYSTDDTKLIAERHGAEVLLHKNPGWVEDENTVALIKNTVTTPWIYWAFADELLDEESLNAVITAVTSEKYKIINIARKNFYYGKFCHEAYADRLNRIFEKNALDFTGNKIHNFGRSIVGKDKICYLDAKKYYVRHFISNTAKSYLATIDKYTDIQAQEHTDFSSSRLFLHLIKSFLKNYIFGRAYKAGKPGLFFVLQMMYYQSILLMKIYEKKNDLSGKNIEKLNNVERESMLKVQRK
ncbi:glycosyltransferase [Janthinobacterium lividum]|uniref:glycosyltransferase n=1 Tax=Janthinobacterium lividum TaxID=29581 RepID=UPI0009B876BD|nr:glycosyltransferase [Janthinobacterium lividum]QKY05604.1 glycosyltransferase [Janthinobacterium lividum]QKY11233.1 glycosyltransferase [Janthinobacterium lividum]